MNRTRVKLPQTSRYFHSELSIHFRILLLSSFNMRRSSTHAQDLVEVALSGIWLGLLEYVFAAPPCKELRIVAQTG